MSCIVIKGDLNPFKFRTKYERYQKYIDNMDKLQEQDKKKIKNILERIPEYINISDYSALTDDLVLKPILSWLTRKEAQNSTYADNTIAFLQGSYAFSIIERSQLSNIRILMSSIYLVCDITKEDIILLTALEVMCITIGYDKLDMFDKFQSTNIIPDNVTIVPIFQTYNQIRQPIPEKYNIYKNLIWIEEDMLDIQSKELDMDVESINSVIQRHRTYYKFYDPIISNFL